jgi:hypothetical protein
MKSIPLTCFLGCIRTHLPSPQCGDHRCLGQRLHLRNRIMSSLKTIRVRGKIYA